MYPKTANRVHNVTYWMNYIMHQVMLQTYLKELLSLPIKLRRMERKCLLKAYSK